MKSFFARFVVAALCIGLAAPLALAQELEKGVEIPGTLTAESKFSFTIDSEEGYYVFGHVDQLTVDVVVSVLNPDGEVIGNFDSPARGPEPFQFTPDANGTYTIEVTSFEGADGDFKILLIAHEVKATDPKKLVDQMMTPFTGKDVPGATVSVLKDGKVIFAKGYGMANLTDGVDMSTTTGMSIASVSKQFTAMAILLLQQDGKLALDDDIRTHIPELKDFGTPITIRNMLNHTSGYREVLNFLPMMGWDMTDGMTREEPIRVVQRQANLQNAPGTEYNYNNTTFMILATVVERVSGENFREFMESRIFRPLGMTKSTVKTQKGQVIPGSSQGYAAAEGGGFAYVNDFASAYGASGVNSTAVDMTKWMLNYRDAKVGGPGAIEALTTRGILVSGDTTGYALGLGVRKYRGRTLYTHTGGETSHRTYFGYFPELDAGLFFSSNNPSFSLAVWTDFADAFFGDELEPVEEEEPEVEEPASDSSEPTTEQLEAIAGSYQFVGSPLVIEYTVEDGKLKGQATGQPQFAVTPTSDSTFTFVGVEASVTFHYEEDGSVERAIHHQGGNTPMERIDTSVPLTQAELEAYTGRYFNEELETVYTVVLEDSALTFHHRNYDSEGLTHVTGDDFSSGFWFLASVKFDRDPAKAISGFMGSNGRTRDVWFAKMD